MMPELLPRSSPVQVALIGYGSAAKIFHAPLIAGVPGLQLACICSTRADAVHADWPAVRVVASPSEVFADASIDLVVIATPNDSHHPLARAALEAGKHVVVDKPFTMDLAEAEDLLALAKAKARVLSVFHNRRFDADFLTLQDVLSSGRLGRLGVLCVPLRPLPAAGAGPLARPAWRGWSLARPELASGGPGRAAAGCA